MTYLQLLEKVKQLKLQEIRKDSMNLLEVVVSIESLKQVCSVLESYFGVPFKPAGKKPNAEIQKKTASLGGIRENQTLYFVEEKGIFNCAMLWPWSDGKLVTIKIAQYEQKEG